MANNTLLSRIKGPEDIKHLSYNELKTLALEIRKEILTVVGHNGGHLASNLGVIELTLAIHRVFSSPYDSIVWDVGHQSYTHKMITGRQSRFSTLRLWEGLSGFPKKEESVHDAFNTGHASTSISAALGILEGKRLKKDTGKVIAVIGDGAMTGGMAFEALSNAGELKKDLIVIINDNKMSIGKNTGAFSEYLSRLTVHEGYQRFKYLFDKTISSIPLIGNKLNSIIWRLKRGMKGIFYKNNIFVDFGFEYVGPINGHNIKELEKVLKNVKKLDCPVVMLVETIKGKGYPFAEINPSAFHGIGPFNIADGKVEKNDAITFTQAFGKSLVKEAEKDSGIVAITAAMESGTGLSLFHNKFPERFFDVGIAEAHAVTFAAGLASAGMKPVAAIYSTFLQRAIDQVIHDTSIQNLPVIFAIDRAGPVPADGETHQGLFDIALLRPVPNMTILCPASEKELNLMLSWALIQDNPVAIRYPKADCPKEIPEFSQSIETGRGVLIKNSDKSRILIACTGGMYKEVKEASAILAHKSLFTDIYNVRFAKPVDEKYFLNITKNYSYILFVEDGMKIGSLSSYLESLVLRHQNKKAEHQNKKTAVLAFEDMFFPHGTRSEIFKGAGVSAEHIAQAAELLFAETYTVSGTAALNINDLSLRRE
ncbi:1-deoxy-D-xylulose-5-phosphate synthase [Treponema putidum]|uniref:1-deoxy-D-xylulose-5-phosphate synthase n=1 Tax=Treponema putidum TaxID=221027 RepID=A0AAE9SHG7_9SPIR|nr:1-deoxy-D-xylulose-5-phosphate synthase [Treponema putidum]AIN94184.1 1-deoxy-D-xylulose-5-phosphate synthase [Treponema putidum]UTY30010.1 1-deoxy-D-xylulose-5-phosphate synthase [Treponema putidum]UTY32466.1 1-deoxy-D-xylulose-5-phosphate synthase [Treponema putidum]UTY33045.1 1-deoxy-D-xylulose-5-phosphate synthase [Treponema putidum]